jgi:hypothetical protein
MSRESVKNKRWEVMVHEETLVPVRTFREETLEIAAKQAQELPAKFMEEVERLLNCGALDPQDHDRSFLFGLAIENISDMRLGNLRGSRRYKNVKGR